MKKDRFSKTSHTLSLASLGRDPRTPRKLIQPTGTSDKIFAVVGHAIDHRRYAAHRRRMEQPHTVAACLAISELPWRSLCSSTTWESFLDVADSARFLLAPTTQQTPLPPPKTPAAFMVVPAQTLLVRLVPVHHLRRPPVSHCRLLAAVLPPAQFSRPSAAGLRTLPSPRSPHMKRALAPCCAMRYQRRSRMRTLDKISCSSGTSRRHPSTGRPSLLPLSSRVVLSLPPRHCRVH